MTYYIGPECIDVIDASCVAVCPVDCIYTGARKLYIQPDECIACGACEPVCAASAIRQRDDRAGGAGAEGHAQDDARFFASPLPGRDAALGLPGGADELGSVGVDTELVAAYSGSGGA
jgi:NAD-dependent dihydropyrimidine dehydrogenase PreA subunit